MSTEELNEIKKLNENFEWLKSQSEVGELRKQLLRVHGGATPKNKKLKGGIDKEEIKSRFKKSIMNKVNQH